MFRTGFEMMHGFTKGVSVDVLNLLINGFLRQICLTVNPGPTKFVMDTV